MPIDRPTGKYSWRDHLQPQEKRFIADLDKQAFEARSVLAAISEDMNRIRNRAIGRAKYLDRKRARAAQ
jgi:hypothetical protein